MADDTDYLAYDVETGELCAHPDGAEHAGELMRGCCDDGGVPLKVCFLRWKAVYNCSTGFDTSGSPPDLPSSNSDYCPEEPGYPYYRPSLEEVIHVDLSEPEYSFGFDDAGDLYLDDIVDFSDSFTGFVSVSGTSVTFKSDTPFDTDWPAGTKILLGAPPGQVEYTIASVDSQTSLTLREDAGSSSGIRYEVTAPDASRYLVVYAKNYYDSNDDSAPHSSPLTNQSMFRVNRYTGDMFWSVPEVREEGTAPWVLYEDARHVGECEEAWPYYAYTMVVPEQPDGEREDADCEYLTALEIECEDNLPTLLRPHQFFALTSDPDNWFPVFPAKNLDLGSDLLPWDMFLKLGLCPCPDCDPGIYITVEWDPDDPACAVVGAPYHHTTGYGKHPATVQEGDLSGGHVGIFYYKTSAGWYGTYKFANGQTIRVCPYNYSCGGTSGPVTSDLGTYMLYVQATLNKAYWQGLAVRWTFSRYDYHGVWRFVRSWGSSTSTMYRAYARWAMDIDSSIRQTWACNTYNGWTGAGGGSNRVRTPFHPDCPPWTDSPPVGWDNEGFWVDYRGLKITFSPTHEGFGREWDRC